MKKANYLIPILLSILTVIPFASCKKEKKFHIGISQCSDDDWRAKMNAEIRLEAMLHNEVDVDIVSADDSNEKQIEDIKKMVADGCDLIMVAPNEAAPLTPIVKEVYDKGIPVIIFDRSVNGNSYTAYIGVDNKGLGEQAAKYAGQIIDKDTPVIEIYGRPGSTPAEDRHSGFAKYYSENGGKILASVPGNWNKEDATAVVDSLLKQYPETGLIFAHNDRMAIGASEVAKAMGRNDIKIIGIDAAPNIGIRAVADSVIDATFLYPTEGHRLVQVALQVLNGEKVDKTIMLPTTTSVVDHSNAGILLSQNDILVEETSKIEQLKTEINNFWEVHSAQTFLFYSCVIILLLVCVLCFMLLRAYWAHKRHQAQLMEQNGLLERERDKQKQLNEKLEEATQSKLVFFTNVSHDLRTPLTLIAEPVRQLANASNLNPKQMSLVRLADKNVKILQRLTNQILDFRKYENGKLEMKVKEVDMRVLMKEWFDSFVSICVKRHIHLNLEPKSGDNPVLLAVDPEMIERVFFNIMSNAVKFTPANGTINVKYEASDTRFTFSIADSGVGISERDLDNIFDRFYQIDRIQPKGSGIGLTLAKAFVEMHDGTIKVDSVVGKGTTFTVELPITHSSPKLDSDIHKSINVEDVDVELDMIETELKFDENKPLILIVDDNEDVLQLVSTLINGDYNVITAASGKQGLKKAVKYVPDLIISDIMMPGMSGLELTQKLKQEVSTSHIPVLLLTACSRDEQQAQGFSSGADAYLAKPFSNEVLQAQIASLIENRKRIKDLWQSVVVKSADGSEKSKRRAKVTQLSVGSNDLDNDFYARFLEIVNNEMGSSDLSVDKVASMMGLERSQFYRKIKAMTNYSPVELIRTLRLKRGRELLTTTEKTISEIAYETGFSTPAYFTKCYREYYGQTPSEVRNTFG